MSNKKILYLYREINPYNIPVFKELVKLGFEIIVIHDTDNKLTPFKTHELEKVEFIPKNIFSQKQLCQLALDFQPQLVYVSDRTIRLYNQTAVILRKKLGIPVIMGCDTQWYGGKQWFNVLTSWFRHKRYFSHILVAGMRQFEYAKKLGFSNNEILWPLNSGHTELFSQSPINYSKFRQPRNFLYAGRFAKVKGLDILLEAWSQLHEKNGATLTLVGSGPLKNSLKYPEDVIILDFMEQSKLADLAGKSSCFVLPSIYEPWALVIHEFAASGLPLIVTDVCGAAPHFVINNYNGFIVKSNSVESLKLSMQKIIELPDKDLYEFALRSRELSKSITPEMVAYAINSVLK